MLKVCRSLEVGCPLILSAPAVNDWLSYLFRGHNSLSYPAPLDSIQETSRQFVPVHSLAYHSLRDPRSLGSKTSDRPKKDFLLRLVSGLPSLLNFAQHGNRYSDFFCCCQLSEGVFASEDFQMVFVVHGFN